MDDPARTGVEDETEQYRSKFSARKTPSSWLVKKPVRPEDEGVIRMLKNNLGKLDDMELYARVYVERDDGGNVTTDFGSSYAKQLNFVGLPVYVEHKYYTRSNEERAHPNAETNPVGEIAASMVTDNTRDLYVKIHLNKHSMTASEERDIRSSLRNDILRDVSMSFTPFVTQYRAEEQKKEYLDKGIACVGPFACGKDWINLHEVSLCHQSYFPGTNILTFRASLGEGTETLMEASANSAAANAAQQSSEASSNAPAASTATSSQSAAPTSASQAATGNSATATNAGSGAGNTSLMTSASSSMSTSLPAASMASGQGGGGATHAQTGGGASTSASSGSSGAPPVDYTKMFEELKHHISNLNVNSGSGESGASSSSANAVSQSSTSATNAHHSHSTSSSTPPPGTGSNLSMQQVVAQLLAQQNQQGQQGQQQQQAQPQTQQAESSNAGAKGSSQQQAQASGGQAGGSQAEHVIGELMQRVNEMQRTMQEERFVQSVQQSNIPQDAKEFLAKQAANADEPKIGHLRETFKFMQQIQPGAQQAQQQQQQQPAAQGQPSNGIIRAPARLGQGGNNTSVNGATPQVPATKRPAGGDQYAPMGRLTTGYPIGSAPPFGAPPAAAPPAGSSMDTTPARPRTLQEIASEKLGELMAAHPDNMISLLHMKDEAVKHFLDTLMRPPSETTIGGKPISKDSQAMQIGAK